MKVSFLSLSFKTCILFTLLSVLTHCKNPSIDYKYENEEDMFQCDIINQDLFKEALYSFENHIKTFYIVNPPNTISQAYAFYWEIAIRDQMPALDLFDSHLIKLVEILKNEKDLWIPIDDGFTLNHNHEIMKCIQKGIKDPFASESLLNMLDSNSFQEDAFMRSIGGQAKNLIDDKALATYFALNHFFAKVLNVDFENIKKKTLSNNNLND